MKKSLYVISFLILLIVVFFGGARFNQRDSRQNSVGPVDRQILHYVDPMNPGNTSKEPGIAPCGMPMEPVYADDTHNAAGGIGSGLSATPGTVKINLQKQQIIGVQLGDVTKTTETYTIRTLGRVAPDENRVYALIAATDGWLEEISESTTGSLVDENQLLARIKVNNYDFFTWQQRYLTELGYTRHISVSPSPLSGTDQSRRRALSGTGYQAGLPIPESEIQLKKQTAVRSQIIAEDLPPHETELLSPPDATLETSPSPNHAEPLAAAHVEHTPQGEVAGPDVNRENNLLYASKGRQELLNLGVGESQLKALAESGAYITHIEVRSPVDGFVLSRQVSPLQRIERGAECFRIADLGKVWIEADVYDIEGKAIQPGMQARVTLPKQREHFVATVSEVLPRFDAASRSLKVRLEMDNPAYVFRPDMFVDVEFLTPLPESISVPSSAVIDSGKRQTVYVIVGEGIFEPRTVVTGWQMNDRVEIVEGLQPGEKIVVSGNFLIDSESRMKLAAMRLLEDKTEIPLTASEAKPKDPVCGMTVNKDKAVADGLTIETEGKTYYFCSADCKEQFKQDPLRFLGEKAGQQAQISALGHGGHSHD